MFTAVALVCNLMTNDCQAVKSVEFLETEEQCLEQLLELKLFMINTGKFLVKDATCIEWMVEDESF